MVEHPTGARPTAALGLVVSLAAVAVVAVLGGLASASAAQDYGRLEQPSWAPPASVFGPTWTALYTLMAVAAWLVWRSGPLEVTRPALLAYAGQLLLNAVWTPLFFGLGWRGVAFVEICLLWVALVVTVVLFWRRRPVAGALLLPYLAWTSFAVCLNLAVWQLNT
jgi:tryptophan-rich sensory protein